MNAAQAAGDLTSGAIIFINYLSAFEEKKYHADARVLASFLRDAARTDYVLAHYNEIVARRVGIGLFDELNDPSLISESMPTREVQFYLNLSIFRLVEAQLPIRAVAGYSAGYWQTFVASGAYDVDYFDTDVRRIVMKIRWRGGRKISFGFNLIWVVQSLLKK